QGHATAQYNLGRMYANGLGVPEDDVEAVEWYRKASKQGHTEAQTELGRMCEFGLGVAEDDVEAYAWFSVAAAVGGEVARVHRDSIKADLTPSEIAKGQKMAREIFKRIQQ
ncbi:MAG TPA: sel1 repeat family protein, partial [Lentisphaeria bacterium]|nr:sel1 repeat family protein [Lentisphaeria bacterium]